MPIIVNPLILQDLFYRVLDDLEFSQNHAYSDDVCRLMKHECEKQRMQYVQEFKKILDQNSRAAQT